MQTSEVVAWGSVAQGMRNLPGTGTEPISPTLAGIFLTTDHQRSPLCSFFDWIAFLLFSLWVRAKSAAKSLQSCSTLCNPWTAAL